MNILKSMFGIGMDKRKKVFSINLSVHAGSETKLVEIIASRFVQAIQHSMIGSECTCDLDVMIQSNSHAIIKGTVFEKEDAK
jgi:hypothetical protein